VSDQVLDVQEPGSPTAKIDGEELVVGVNTVFRERTQVAGANPLEVSRVTNTDPDGTEYGLVTRPIMPDPLPVSIAVSDGSEATKTRRLLEEILLELKTLNAKERYP
jgi:hypothetical protein